MLYETTTLFARAALATRAVAPPPASLGSDDGPPFLVMRGVLAGAAAAAAIGCSTAPETEGELRRPAGASHGVGEGDSVALGAAPAALSSDGAVCVTIQRGALGTVRDATLWQNAPGWNDSASPNLSTGSAAGAGRRRSVVYFGLSPVPVGATVLSASLVFHQTYAVESSAVSVHRVTIPWDERTVTWSSIGDSGFESESAATIAAEAGVGARAADVSALVRSWALGTARNDGVLLAEDDEERAHTTYLRSSEIGSTQERPRLDVCYVTCSDGVMNGLEVGLDCGGPHCAPCTGATAGTSSVAASSAAVSSAAASSSTGASSAAGDEPCADGVALPPEPLPPRGSPRPGFTPTSRRDRGQRARASFVLLTSSGRTGRRSGASCTCRPAPPSTRATWITGRCR